MIFINVRGNNDTRAFKLSYLKNKREAQQCNIFNNTKLYT